MAGKEISALNVLSGANVDVNNDLLEIVDVSEASDADKNKKITPKELVALTSSFSPLGAGSVAGTVQSQLRKFVFLSDYDTQGNYETARNALTGKIAVPSLESVTASAVTRAINWSHSISDTTGFTSPYTPFYFGSTFTATTGPHTAGNVVNGGLAHTIVYGSGGVASIGTVAAVQANVVISGAGNDSNEYSGYFSAVRADIGTGFTQTAAPVGRLWQTDFSVHGPVGVQPDMMAGVTQFINNYYNGSATNGAYGVVITTKRAAGGSLDATHSAAETYPVDIGLLISGAAGSGAAPTSRNGFDRGIVIGWLSSALSGPWGVTDARIGTGIQINKFIDFGLRVSGRHASGTGPAIAVDSGAGSVIIGGTAMQSSSSLVQVNGRTDMYSAAGGIQLVLGDATADAVSKVARIGSAHFTNAEEPTAIAVVSGGSLGLGGGSGVLNAANQISFYTAANTTTVTGTERWRVSSAGHFLAPTDNTYDIGASGATRPRTGYFGTSVVTPIITNGASALEQRDGTNAQTFNNYSTYTSATDYQRSAWKQAKSTLSAVSGASVTATTLIPDGAFLIGVTTRINTTLGVTNGTTGYTVGDGTDPDLWGAVVGTAAGTATKSSDFTAVGACGLYTAAQSVVITATGGNFNGTGAIEVVAHYLTTEAD
jgi:hypothetical protein